ncbi:type II toxin-antitoxin system Phd/YefM family antitoxin [Thiothrix nivea]|uniref:Antitoxin n=1 Tax=Thiothrix nivea (strain ATCC 35100 / DSM 5205 / JP2) TaxID=870187 RepID=A0A656HE58_THINJ|nr:type II toxin-antitoxin system Phd/YefM family antitoxin [Thiothrix nivea]EIJ33710.1 prevent-host-death family protein [Thiothrix nivea DSM 5205]
MLREAPAMTVRQNLGELLNEVQYKRDQIVITKAGKPVAALIGIPLFERLQQMEQEFARMTKHMQQAFADMQESDLNDLLDEAIQHTRGSRTAA